MVANRGGCVTPESPGATRLREVRRLLPGREDEVRARVLIHRRPLDAAGGGGGGTQALAKRPSR
ncbi:hypothetical protein APB27_30425 [Pseudomonas aeruginosa]|nr:hypothetical protein B7D75_16355 [Pseudomonas paraeruginosa]OPD81705.1 hypothetical protein AO940_29845 [Pseudomonas aeruginosa]OPE32522.1 hypothetical protein APB27_30425 [Pseudomonas aeruginosa]RQB89606.1 hypothetical protein IPC434_11195 [Pseudomonas aeruginosa]RTT39965.1 hypothetical protein DY956_06475 [Pseudomonas paraeruginosa]